MDVTLEVDDEEEGESSHYYVIVTHKKIDGEWEVIDRESDNGPANKTFRYSFSSTEISIGYYWITLDVDGFPNGNDYFELNPNKPNISSISVDGTQVTIGWSPKDFELYTPGYGSGFCTFWFRQVGNRWVKFSEIVITSSSMTSIFTVDRFNTDYEVRLQTTFECLDDERTYESEYSTIKSFTTEELKPWSWTSVERAAFLGNGLTNNLTASRWRDFCGYVNGVSGEAKNYGYGDGSVVNKNVYSGIQSGTKMEGKYFIETFKLINFLCTRADVSYDYPRRW